MMYVVETLASFLRRARNPPKLIHLRLLCEQEEHDLARSAGEPPAVAGPRPSHRGAR